MAQFTWFDRSMQAIYVITILLCFIAFFLIQTPYTVSYQNIFKVYMFKTLCMLFAAYLVVVLGFTFDNVERLRNFTVLHITIIVFTLFAGALLELLPQRDSGCGIVSEKYHHIMKPNCVMIETSPEYTYEIATNEIGLRTPALEQDKRNVLLLGDSFTLGQGVAYNETYAAVLQSNVTEDVQIVNAGILSNAPVLMDAWLRDHIEIIDPEIIVVSIDVSDYFQDKAYTRFAYQVDGVQYINGTPDKETGRFQASWFSVILQSKLFKLLDVLSRALVLIAPVQPEFGTSPALGDFKVDPLAPTRQGTHLGIQEQINITLQATQRIVQTANQHDATVIVGVYPWGHQVNEKEWDSCKVFYTLDGRQYPTTLQNSVVDYFTKQDVVTVDATADFKQIAQESQLYFPCDGHWNADGHKVYAQALLPAIQAELADS